MVTRTVLLSGFLAALGAGAANAAIAPEDFEPRREASDEIRLAQSGDVEVYYDTRGRRVIVDAWTGEILAIQPSRREQETTARERRDQRMRERRNPERYYLDDPDDVARLRRDMQRDLGIVVEPDTRYSAVPEDDLYLGEPDDYTLRDRRETRKPIVAPPPEKRTVKRVEKTDSEPPVGDVIIENPIEPSVNFAARREVAELQVLLDRRGASPGVIDGQFGSNVDKALIAYRELTGENLKSTDAAGIKKALAETGGDAFTTYTITPEDAAGPYVASVPADYGQKAKLDHLSYTSVSEMLAERFHMDEAYLKSLNPEAVFNRPGTTILVAKTGADVKAEVARIVADKGRKQVRAYDAGGKLVAAYPATIGSSDTPSPTGTHSVARIAFDPEYTYNPNLNFKQGENHKVLRIPPGPNGPVGSIWIALSKPTYGIHGTPEPSKIGKTESHGCVRLTNWDAQELARIVKAGVEVEFVE
ncbi:MAG: L,D-transpeptidase family protein [Rhizobiaceae bacterium]|nr:L,D-transpeptidase family protein [Rhizobiaceae bacterium]